MNPYAALGLGILLGFGATVCGIAVGTAVAKDRRLKRERRKLVAALVASCLAVAGCGGGSEPIGDGSGHVVTIQPVDCGGGIACR